MLRPKARWKLQQADETTVDRLARELHIEPLMARLLVVRGMTTAEQVQRFMEQSEGHGYDPFLLDGMREAVERIRLAISRQEKIRVYGDYDADGVSSTSLMIYVLRQLNAKFDYYIPHRAHEGYGLNNPAIDHAHKHHVSLIVTVDTGISAYEQVEYAGSLGLDVIVTDHHEPPETLPRALAVINPKKPGCPYPFKHLAGVGVACKLAQALLNGQVPDMLLEIASIGTVADLMPLVDENRAIVKAGLRSMQNSSLLGVKALLGVAGALGKEVTATHIAYALAPRINASGRLDNADDAVKLLTTSNEQEAEHLAYGLDQLNKERQRIVEDITAEALRMMEEPDRAEDKVIVLAAENWNVGVIGIVASKILERYYRPTIILSIDPESGMAKGSARSIAGFDIYQALSMCKDLLDHYGGHQAAAGMSLQRGQVSALRVRLNELARSWLTEQDLVPLLYADAVCGLDEVPVPSIERIGKLAPFGMGNPAPKLVFTNLKVQEIRTMGRERQHLKLALGQSKDDTVHTIEALGFGKGAMSAYISPTSEVDILGELSVNEWNGNRKPQIFIQDIRVNGVQVFDWRRSGTLQDKMREWRESFASMSDRGLSVNPLYICSEADKRHVSELDCGLNAAIRIWRPAAVRMRTLETQAGANDMVAGATDIFIFSPPGNLRELEQVLSSAKSAERIYVAITGQTEEGGAFPSTDSFKRLYRFIRQKQTWRMDSEDELRALSLRTGLSRAMIRFMLDVFEELEFVEKTGSAYQCNPSPSKRELSSSVRYRDVRDKAESEQTLVYSTSRQLTEWILARLNQKAKMEDII